MVAYSTRSQTRYTNIDAQNEKQYTNTRNRLLYRANELSEQHGCQVAVIVIKDGQVTQYSSCDMVDVLRTYSDMCTQPHLSLNKKDFEKCEASREEEEMRKSGVSSDNLMSETPSAADDFNQIGPLSLYSQGDFEVEGAPYQVQLKKEDSYQDILRNFEWYAQEMHHFRMKRISYFIVVGRTSRRHV
eukprot:TRINITY_DN84438_c0_g1_i9.p2 TRINITY_DN84438_c0_g1~~TRINITY_DN84438_c0_g1_i9.p2  ORF type:complete len:187 (-),score=16.09 TRINITY_DN84438_c0_g1_i9:517-1077(-)